MLNKFALLLCLTTVVVPGKASPQGVPKDKSSVRMYSSAHAPRTYWSYRSQDDYRHAPEGISHGYDSHSHGATLKATESSYDHSAYPATSREYWRPNSYNFTSLGYYGYSRPYFGSTSTAGGLTYQDSVQGSHSPYQYQQMRPAAGSYPAYKKTPVYHTKGKLQVQNSDVLGKPKYKKTPLTSYKQAVYPRVHKPYAKHKYPIQKTVHSSYRRYYTSPYQRYSVAPSEMLRFRVKAQNDGYYRASTASPTPSKKHHTTERMDDAYPDGSAPSEDYSAYNDTQNGNQASYYEAEEESERTTSEPEESSYDESTTRGYYGDRIFMSTQVPFITPDKTGVKNKYYIIRRTSGDDLETIFDLPIPTVALFLYNTIVSDDEQLSKRICGKSRK